MFPKILMLKMFIHLVVKHKLNIVSYQCIDLTLPRGGYGAFLWKYKFYRKFSVDIWDLTKFSDVNVHLNKDNRIVIEKQNGWRQHIPEKLKKSIK